MAARKETNAIDAIDALLAHANGRKGKRPRKRINNAEPAHSIIRKLGGPRKLSRALGISAAACTRWQRHKTPSDRHGCDGLIPEARRSAIIAVAKDLRIRLTKADFIKS